VTTRALVLGSGGLTGVAWEAGVLDGLTEVGYPITGWDLVVGSSAGAFVGARLLAEGSPGPLFKAQQSTDLATDEAALGAVTGQLLGLFVRASRRRGLARLDRLGVIALILRAALTNAARDGLGELAVVRAAARSRRPNVPPEVGIRAMGRLARGVRTDQEVWIDYWVRALAPIVDWPDGRLVITALDITDGTRKALDRNDGVPLARAIAASSAIGGLLPPVSIGQRRYMDGGTGSQTNADLAAGHDQVLVLAPVNRGSLAGEVRALLAAGSVVRVIEPSPASRASLGKDLGRMDPARRAAAAQAGRDDGHRFGADDA
jgi:NTE family protein